jgi:transcriptional regulator with XRE-family HTH domain
VIAANEPNRLGEFLQARRSRLRPADIELATYGDRRRVPGLRREEVALLAGVSASYYTRLEQGQSQNASPDVLNAIAGALDLDESERRHLHDLAGVPKRGPVLRKPPPERINDATRTLLDAMEGVPALVTGRRGDVLAWNRLGHALFAGHLDPLSPERSATRPNMASAVFLDEHIRDLYADWPSKARAVVGNLRAVVGRYADDALLARLIGELSMKSDDFAAMWADHRVQPCDIAVYHMRHPLLGTLTVVQQSLRAADDQHIVVGTTQAGTPSREAISMLASMVSSSVSVSLSVPV